LPHEHFELPAKSGLPESGEEQTKENIEDGLYSNFIVSVSWTQGEDKTKENMLPETATFDGSLSSTAREAAETWVTAPVTPKSPAPLQR